MPHEEPERRLRAWQLYLLLTCVLGISLAAVRWGQSEESPTTDEWAHFTRGLSYWQTGDFRLGYAHPPLANLVAAIPAASDERLPEVASLPAWSASVDAGQLSVQILDVDYAAAREALMRCRRAMAGFLLIAVAYVFWFVRRLSNDLGGLAAAMFVGWNPTLVAHARYVTTDLAAAVTIGIATCEIALLASRRGSVLRASVAVALALLTKHSAIVLLPLLVVAIILTARKWAIARRLAIAGAICLVSINAAYGFQRTGMRVDDVLAAPEPVYWISGPYEGELLETQSPLPWLPASARVPLPYTYIFGVTCIREQMRRGYPRGTFLGQPVPYGHWGYFPLMLLLKVPLDLILVLLVGVAVVGRSRERPRMNAAVRVVAWSTLALILLLLPSRLNMGIRHALPQICLLGVVGGLLVSAILQRFAARVGVCMFGGLLGVRLVGLAWAGPHYLGWCNVLVSPDRCVAVAAAGEDWGQDLAALARNARRLSWSPLIYDDPTNTRGYELEHHDVKVFPHRCGTDPFIAVTVAVHVHELQLHGRECFSWLDKATLLCSVNHHIRVYRVPGVLGSAEDEPTSEDCDDLAPRQNQ